MPVRAEVRERVRALLPGQEPRYVLEGSVVMAGGVPVVGTASVLVVVTAEQVVLLSCSRWRRGRPTGVLQRLPRATRLGPVEVQTGCWIRVGDWQLEVDDLDVPVVAAADAELDGLQPDDPGPAGA
ncbi:hypothetical protein [Vallicoccus soli]|uniref:Uncharacterized protein n=1 Tax=Vallicoccus soli TaxID=2339232 RepID=A0A3A3YUV3_9ACTN|nr:hypothetical protein [Vallicoccus soli]RJK95280.1 hypothetical protein D5H78_11450 [Vallicoccus soli]